ncbi:MAG: outer membrane lipoprotein carrier protein LolA [Treponema sp.]|jgi:outer membrane lipoprotein-sorting protein|nr:outer membrane lipoprotein carrier protein LolA [Treponema sp.]
MRLSPALVTFALLLCVVFSVFSQEIITADRYLESVSERYGRIRDYEAQVVIRSGSTDMTGNLSFLNPFFLRIDFTRPMEQVMVFNGETLTVYIPDLRAVLNQAIAPVRRTGTVGGVSLASAQGLQLLRRGYVPTFVSGPAPVPLDERSREMVVKLRLTRRLASEGFREIILSIDPETRLIRRIEGRTIAEALVRFDFSNIRTNLGIPEQRFIYDSPASANMYNNFLFRESD